MSQLRIPAVYMRGGTSKGVFFHAKDLPADPARRDRALLRVIGSPDPYGKQIDGMGGATSSTSKVVILSPSTRSDCDVDYLFGQVPIDKALIDYSGNCGNLTSAVGPFAISEGLVEAPREGTATVRIWQSNIGKRILAHVPVRDGQVVEEGGFHLDGVAFPAAEVVLEFLDLDDDAALALFPTGNVRDDLEVPGLGRFPVTLITAGNPTVFLPAKALGLRGTETAAQVDPDRELLARCEAIRARAAVVMGLAASDAEATDKRPHTPKLAFVAPPQAYAATSGRPVAATDMDFTARILSMGRLHHAMTGTGAVAIAAAAAIPGTIVHELAGDLPPGRRVRFGHPAGTLAVLAQAENRNGKWQVTKAVMSRSARRLMEGWVRIPDDAS